VARASRTSMSKVRCGGLIMIEWFAVEAVDKATEAASVSEAGEGGISRSRHSDARCISTA
jgi:hypothetical protein